MTTGPRGSVSAEMNITPFIDVLLVLLIIYMLSVHVSSIELQLAQEQATAPRDDAPIVLELPDSGGYVVNRRPVEKADLHGFLRQAYAGRSGGVLFVRSGPGRTYREAIEAIDIALGAGVRTVAMAP